MSTPSNTPASPLLQRVRRWIVGVIIVSFGIAALGGIAVLLSGAFDETAGKVLGTTALVGLFSVAALCGVALFGKRAQWFGWVTIVISVITLVWLLWIIWSDAYTSESTFQAIFSLCILTAAGSVASLLLLLADHRSARIRVVLYLTLAFLALGVLLSIFAIWELLYSDTEAYWRGTGVVWILAALGIVVLPVMSLLLRSQHTQGMGLARDQASNQAAGHIAEGTAGHLAGVQPVAPETVSMLSPDSLARIQVAAQAQRITTDELVRRLLP